MAACVRATTALRACGRCSRLMASLVTTNVRNVAQTSISMRLLSTSHNPLLHLEPAGEANLESKTEHPADYEISDSEFKYVEQILPKLTVPAVPHHEVYPTPSGWYPPSDTLRPKKSFLVRRTRNHMLPVYPKTCKFWYGMNHSVVIKSIEGDIWALESEIRDFLMKKTGINDIRTQVHEVSRQVRIRGEHTALVAEFLLDCGM